MHFPWLLPLVTVLYHSKCAKGLLFGISQQKTLGVGLDELHGSTGSTVKDEWDLRTVREHLVTALEVMQHEYFEVWIGQWPTSIDWTGAVIATHLSSTLRSLSWSTDSSYGPSDPMCLAEKPWCAGCCSPKHCAMEDRINSFFAQLQAYYFGEDAFAVRLEAHDDMLWVALGWLEAIRFIDTHDRHHATSRTVREPGRNRQDHWHGTLFTPAFAHRSHVFYELVSPAWDDDICDGGITWNPRLEPYKNAVTNEQFISAAVGMYLHHPGDSNTSPFMASRSPHTASGKDGPRLQPIRARDPEFLQMARKAYTWLKGMNMTNAAGLYADGFHARSHWDPRLHKRVYGACDLRNEMVYTYNQGVILSGLRQLWEVTGDESYLDDGHTLVHAVIASTGWPETNESEWKGLGYDGYLTEFCDTRGACSQDAQTFKGIFWHHLGVFCEPRSDIDTDDGVWKRHAESCMIYTKWVEWNARAAWRTRNEKGVIGSWWGAPRWRLDYRSDLDLDAEKVPMPELPAGAVNYRNEVTMANHGNDHGGHHVMQQTGSVDHFDLNDRGRGRTVESHSGGVGVLRALYSLKLLERHEF